MKVSDVSRRLGQFARFALFLMALTVIALLPPLRGNAAPLAAMVMDARTGKVLYARNADTRLHPASLTKMMTLYIAFEAVENGEISLDTLVKISRNAASEPPSKLGMRPGQKIKLRYLIRAAAIKSANDAATAIGEAISGSEAAFVKRMNRTARALGMSRTTFRNANGLTRSGHLSTARDMTNLGRHLMYDYPQYFHLFSSQYADAGIRKVRSTNIRFLRSYSGAEGIKTGYTAAAGFNLVAAAHRGSKRIITTVFGGTTSASRNAKVRELMDLGFRRAPARAPINRPQRPAYTRTGETVYAVRAVRRSRRPVLRPEHLAPLPSEDVLMAMQSGIENALSEIVSGEKAPQGVALAALEDAALKERDVVPQELRAPQVVTRMSTSGGRLWGINLGSYSTRYEAERVLLRTALMETTTLEDALRKVARSPHGYDANFVGLTEEMADMACQKLRAQSVSCSTLGPG